MTKYKLPADLSSSDNFDDVTSLYPSPNASLHTKIANVSPMKKGTQASYFEGKLTDGTRHVRFVGFVPFFIGETFAIFACRLALGDGCSEVTSSKLSLEERSAGNLRFVMFS